MEFSRWFCEKICRRGPILGVGWLWIVEVWVKFGPIIGFVRVGFLFLLFFLLGFSWLWVGVFLVLDPLMKTVMALRKLLRRIQLRMAPPLNLTMLAEWTQVIKLVAESSFSRVNSVGFCVFSLFSGYGFLQLWQFCWFVELSLFIGFLGEFLWFWSEELNGFLVLWFWMVTFLNWVCVFWDPSYLCAVLLTSSLCRIW